jgi:membrane-associated phospholipid phosphatase
VIHVLHSSRDRLAPGALFAAAGLAALGFAVVARAVTRGKTQRFDRATNRELQRDPSHALELAAVATTPAGKWWGHLPPSLLTAARLHDRGRDAAAVAVVSASLGAVAVTRVLDRWFERRGPQPRRGRLSSHSFPSGHALQTSAVAVTTGYVLAREKMGPSWLPAPLGLVPLAAGLGKLLLARHWSTDVLGGYCAGIAWGATCAGFYEVAVGR